MKASKFGGNVTSSMGEVQDFGIASIADEFKKISLVGQTVSFYVFRTIPMPMLPVSGHAHRFAHERTDPETPKYTTNGL